MVKNIYALAWKAMSFLKEQEIAISAVQWNDFCFHLMYQKKQAIQSLIAIIVNIATAKAIQGMKWGNKRKQRKPMRSDALNNDKRYITQKAVLEEPWLLLSWDIFGLNTSDCLRVQRIDCLPMMCYVMRNCINSTGNFNLHIPFFSSSSKWQLLCGKYS